jgi:hypothetical protein
VGQCEDQGWKRGLRNRRLSCGQARQLFMELEPRNKDERTSGSHHAYGASSGGEGV